MENKSTQIILGIILGIVLVIAGIIIFNASRTATQPYYSNQLQKNTISVSGTSTLEFTPDQAELYFRIETIDQDPKQAQALNTAKSNKIIALLKNNGLSDKDIETLNYNLEKLRKWEKDGLVDKGYKVSHTLKLTVKDLSKVGSFINLIVSNDADNVENIRFSLSKEKELEVKTKMLAEAAKDAKTKAELLANSLDTKVKGLVSLTESSPGYYPYYYAETTSLKSSADETPIIQPKSISLTANVNAVFEIE